MTNLLFREWLNAGLIPLNMCILIVISGTFWDAYQKHGRGWTQLPGMQTACAFWWLFLADLTRACLAWYFLHHQNSTNSNQITVPYVPALVYVAVGVVATAATFRLIYTLGPDSWGHKGWVAAALATIATIIALHFWP